MRRFLVPLALAAVLSGCGNTPTAAPAQDAKFDAALTRAAARAGDLAAVDLTFGKRITEADAALAEVHQAYAEQLRVARRGPCGLVEVEAGHVEVAYGHVEVAKGSLEFDAERARDRARALRDALTLAHWSDAGERDRFLAAAANADNLTEAMENAIANATAKIGERLTAAGAVVDNAHTGAQACA